MRKNTNGTISKRTKGGFMKLYEISLVILIVVVAAAAGIGYISAKFLGDDNPVEEASEEVIKAGTGADIDLTPASPEKRVTA